MLHKVYTAHQNSLGEHKERTCVGENVLNKVESELNMKSAEYDIEHTM